MFADLNGARLHYEVSGTGEPVILIGGFGTNAAFWEHARTLLDGYRVVTYDNRGVGQTHVRTVTRRRTWPRTPSR